MDFIENLLSHMSSTFNRESLLPKQAEIAEDETFKWRALKNNQFASRSKNSQTKRANKNISSVTLAEDINVSNTANEIVIEIANGISKAEIREALTHQSSSIECQMHNVGDIISESYAEGKGNSPEDTCGKNEADNDKTIKLQAGIAETVSTSNLFKHMSSTFNSSGEISIKNITECSGTKQMKSYGNSDSGNVSYRNAAKKQPKTVRRSNRLKQDNLKQILSDHHEASAPKTSQNVANDSMLSRKIQKKELSEDKKTSAIESKSGDQETLTLDCKNTELVGTISAANNDLKNSKLSKCKIEKEKKISTSTVSEPEALWNTKTKQKSTKSWNSSHKKYLKIKRLTPNHNQKHRKNFDCKAMSSSKNCLLRQNYEEVLNGYSKAKNLPRLHGRLSRPIKLSAKILANKKLRHGFELQNSARLGCNSKVRITSELSPEPKILPEIEHRTSVPYLEPGPPKTDNAEIQQFLCEIKHLANNKSPENDGNLNKVQLNQLIKLKEKHFRSLGLRSTSTTTQAFSKSKQSPPRGQKVQLQANKIVETQISNNHQKRKTPISSSFKTNSFEKCLCEKTFPYFTAKTQNHLQCTAIDDINGQLVKCGNKLNGKAPHNFLRSSMRSSFQLLCVLHFKRFRKHSCCPGCGMYCTQGEFAICSRRHLFHIKCAENCEMSQRQNYSTKLLLKCPHCGVKEKSDQLKTGIQLMID